MKSGIDVILVDDHQVVINGLKVSILSKQDFNLLGEARSGQELFSLLKDHIPDVLVLDLVLPDISGADIIKKLNHMGLHIHILIFTGNTPDSLLLEALENGALGLVSKDAPIPEIEKAIRLTAKGESYFGEDIRDEIIFAFIKKNKQNTIPDKSLVNLLSRREIEIIRLLAQGLVVKEIAFQLGISAHTVESHKKNILAKLHLNTVIDVVKFAVKAGLISL